MARGPGAHQAGPPQQRQPVGAAPQPAGWPQAPQDPAWQQPPNGWPAQGHYAQAAPQPYQPQPAMPQAQPAPQPAYDQLARNAEYHYPHTAPPQQRAAQPAPPQPAQPQYAPQFDAYVPPSRPTAPPVQPAPHQTYQPQQPAPQYAPPPAAPRAPQQPHPLQQALQASAQAAPRPELRGSTHDHWPTAAAQPQAQSYQPQPQAYQQQPQPDPRGYDLGHYAPTTAPAPEYEPSLQARTYTQPQGDWAQHGDPRAHVDPTFGGEPQVPTYAQQDGQQPSLEPAGYHNEHAGYETGQELTAEQDYGHEEVEYEEEAPRRSKLLIIVGALVGAIALGGGLAYAYKTFMGPSDKGKVPVVKNDRSPSKVPPVTPGGKQFANADSKVLNGDGGKIGGRLSGDGAGMSGSPQADDGTKRVQVLSVSRDGQVRAPPPAPQTSNPIPGMVLADGGLGPRPATAPVQPAAPPQQVAAPAEPARVQPKVIIAQPQQTAAVAAPPPARQAPPPPAVIDAKTAAAAQSVSAPKKQPVPAKPATMSSPGVGAGWVAVLASQRSSVEALQAFADLKQRYPDLLQNRQPGVQEANLGEKGIYHRLVAGPAGTKEEANALCMQLKASGYTSCWVTAVK